MRKPHFALLLVSMAAILVDSCSREDRFGPKNYGQEIHTVFHISVADNTKTKTKTKTPTKAATDSKTSYDAQKTSAFIDSKVAFGLVGIDYTSSGIIIDNQPVYEKNGVRTADLVAMTSSNSMSVSAYYPFVNNVSYYKDGTCAINFTPNDVSKGPLISNAVDMRCDQDFETVNLRFHHISNSVGFKICDITVDEQLKGLMHVRKVVLHGMPTEGMFVPNGDKSHWVPNAKHKEIVVYEGDDLVECDEENAQFIAADRLSGNNEDCSRHYVIPELLKEGKHYVELIFDVESFYYDGTHYRGLTDKSQIIPLSGVIPDDFFEMGLQYTFVLGMNLGAVYRPIEFTASVEEYELKYNGRILDFDNE